MNSIVKQYPYRLNFWFALFVFLMFFAAGVWIILMQFQNPCSPDMTSGDCSANPFPNDYLGRGAFVLVAVLVVAKVTKSLIESFLSLNSPYRRRVAFTDESVIAPVSKLFGTKEEEINFYDIIEFELIKNRIGLLIFIKSKRTSFIICS